MRRKKLPSYIPLMALVTACYLTVEIPFSVRLVEVLGGSPSQPDIDAMETFGRILTGVAVSIWIVGVLLFPRMHARGRGLVFSTVAAALVGMAATWATYNALDVVAEATGFSSTGEERKEAFLSILARNQIAASGGIDGLRASDANDWKAFVAVSPTLSSSSALASAAGSSVSEMARDEARRLVGSPDRLRKSVFGDGFADVRDAYARYADGSKEYLSAKANLDGQAAEAWDGFQSELRRRYPGGVTRNSFTEAMIYREIKFNRRLPVSRNWDIRDRAEFVRAFKEAGMKKVDESYRREMTIQLGPDEWIRPGLSMDGFVSQPAIQKRIRESLGLGRGSETISAAMSRQSFLSQVYAPTLAATEDGLVRATAASPSEFASGEFMRRGIDSVRAARLPAMAILLSIAGAVLHVYKLSGYLSRLFSSVVGIGFLGGRFRHAVAASVAIAVFAGMATSGNAVTQAPAYAQIKGDGVYSALLHGAISIQPRFSDLGDAIGSFGGWQAFAADMPKPVPYAPSSVQKVASLELPMDAMVPLPTPAPR